MSEAKDTSARWCPCCGTQHAVEKGHPSPWPKITRNQIEAFPDLLAALIRLDAAVRTLQEAFTTAALDEIAESQDQASAAIATAEGKSL
jgi:hypothetical protein